MLLFLLVMVAVEAGSSRHLNDDGLNIGAEQYGDKIHPLAHTNNTLSDEDTRSDYMAVPELAAGSDKGRFKRQDMSREPGSVGRMTGEGIASRTHPSRYLRALEAPSKRNTRLKDNKYLSHAITNDQNILGKYTKQSDEWEDESILKDMRRTASFNRKDQNCGTIDIDQLTVNLAFIPHDPNSEDESDLLDELGSGETPPPGADEWNSDDGNLLSADGELTEQELSQEPSRRPEPPPNSPVKIYGRKEDETSEEDTSEEKTSEESSEEKPPKRFDCRVFKCTNKQRKYLCGNDGQTFYNRCHLDWYNHCFYKFVKIKRKGPCKSKPSANNGNWDWNTYWKWYMNNWQQTQQWNNGNNLWNNHWKWVAINSGNQKQGNQWGQKQGNQWGQQQGNQWGQQQGNQWGQQQGNQWGQQQGNQWGQVFDLDKWAQGDSTDLGGPIDQMTLMNVWNQGAQQGLWNKLDQMAG